MTRRNSILFLLSAVSSGFGQTYQVSIRPPQSDGLHQVELTSDVISASRGGLDYLRIRDRQNREVPYVRVKPDPGTLRYEELALIRSSADKKTLLQINNPAEGAGKTVYLKIAANDLTKTYNLSGSDDGKQWFGLAENRMLTAMNGTEAFVRKEVELPANHFKFIRLEIADKKNAPIFVKAVEVAGFSRKGQGHAELNSFTQKKWEDKKQQTSGIEILFPKPQLISGIGLNISAPNLFHREASVFIPEIIRKKGKVLESKRKIAGFILDSKDSNRINIPAIFSDRLIIEINNESSPPLVIEGMRFYQEKIHLAADLKRGEQYRILVDTTLKAPVYDLAHFENQISQTLPVLSLEPNPVGIPQQDGEKETKKNLWNEQWFIWACIGVALLVIAFFAKSLINDLDKNGNS